jgi:CobQ-like glutamine amidotransferase family enzyme
MSPNPKRSAPIRVVQLFGDLLGTYGDGGNALVLERRAAWRDIAVTRVDVTALDAIPDDGDIYVVGGGEDGPQGRAARLLAESGALHTAVTNGAAVLAVCAGFQIMGRSFVGPEGTTVDGLGLLDVTTTRALGPRIVGEVLVDADPTLGLGRLTGYENHAGVTRLAAGATPLGRVVATPSSSPAATRHEGAFQGRVIGTYLHGPVLARNPALADRLLAWALEVEPAELSPLDDRAVDRLRTARTAAALSGGTGQGDSGPLDRIRRLFSS